ncbi:Endonuclease V [Candidatus Kryptobacter tengchongensis]|uniref:endonuclease V n=1 Tax=Kryptobacter tengchongensis TaxID=1643429 RepID=UPI000707B2BD|nr:endonuclease V [Candidatus Kryptobacter tengchongensis]CUS81503.1 Endonuclease V [Candidatus Kryptobacter tengchongensis]CUU06954.1 Endonuclease V [Candidatus Kryptobacter tengchongensis]
MANYRVLHSWDVSPEEAIKIQNEMRNLVKIENLQSQIRYIAGADISFDKGSNTVYAGIVVLKFPELVEVDRSLLITEVNFPYIPGLLSFRESPALIKAWEKIKIIPDVVIIDGQGIAHPRRFGIASHFGVLIDKPTIGCAKSLLVGKYKEPDEKAGSYSYLYDSGEIIGVALRTRDNVQPVFVSIGHKITLDESIEIIMQSIRGYRIPEPTRQAHMLVNALRRGEIKPGTRTKPEQDSLFS